uniref:Sodium/hydrogen exchanger n=1 Tax=Ascaris suum TaxID=6253 RepID=F1KYG4_ASCSU
MLIVQERKLISHRLISRRFHSAIRASFGLSRSNMASMENTCFSIAVILLFVNAIPLCIASEQSEQPERYQVVSLNWEEVSIPFIIALWILVAAVAKILFHIWPQVSEMFPDSSLLIMVGLFIGIVLSLLHVNKTEFKLESQTFFLYLLPPMMFDAGYFMPARQFFDNLGSILTFAIIGTAWNFVSIGVSLWAVGQTGLFGLDMPFLHYLLFGSLIADVDPVAVIVIFEELQVNDVLYIAVFGESVVNDGVSVVFYRMMLAFTQMGAENIITTDYIYGFISFFVVAFGGIAVGLIWAFVASFVTKHTTNVKILNPIFVILCPYLAYLMCELFGLSSILGIAFCGCAMKQYVRENVPDKAFTAINYFAKVLSLASETVIFVFLGLSTVSSDHHWNSAFIILTVVLCIVYRTLGVTVMCYFLNKGRLRKYSKVEQFIMSYGGLRGAIAYGLVVALPDTLPGKKMFVTSCIIVIYWTVFLQGLTLRPIANFLEVERKNVYRKNMTEYIYQNLIDYTMSGMEDIAGMTGHHTLRNWFNKFNRRFLKPLLLKRGARKKMDNSNIVRAYKMIQKREAEDLLKGADLTQNQLFVEALLRHVRTRVESHSRANTTSTVANGSIIREVESVDEPNFIENPAYLMMEELTEASALNMEVERANGPLALMPFEEPSSSNTKEVHVTIERNT